MLLKFLVDCSILSSSEIEVVVRKYEFVLKPKMQAYTKTPSRLKFQYRSRLIQSAATAN